MVGQSGTALAGALGAGRSDCAAYARSGSYCDLAPYARPSSRADQVSGCANNPSQSTSKVMPRQKLEAAAERALR